MFLTIYLIGFVVALYLIASVLEKEEEYNEGDVLCYIFAFLSWVTVLMLIIDKYFRYESK
jgi:hypothetical protein